MNLLFDLDGTLTDPAVGFTRCIQHALTCLDRETPPAADLARFVGPPLKATFAELLATQDDVLLARAIAHYRERYSTTGIFECVVAPQIPLGLAELVAEGHLLWVVTSKPTVYALRVVEHFGLHPYFRSTYGSELDGRNTDKRALIRIVLEQEALHPRDTWMIGDRVFDIRGGHVNGIRTIGVLWGYGSGDELRAAGPDAVVSSMPDLVAHLRR